MTENASLNGCAFLRDKSEKKMKDSYLNTVKQKH